MNARDPVANRDDRPDFGDVHVDGVVADLIPDDLGDLFCFDLHKFLIGAYVSSSNRCFMRSSCRVTLPSNTRLPTRAMTPPMIEGSTFS